MHTTQVKRCIDLLYLRSDSEKSYKIIEFSETEQESQENHYFNNSSQKDFSQEKLQEVRDIIWAIDTQVTEKMSESEQEYSAEL